MTVRNGTSCADDRHWRHGRQRLRALGARSIPAGPRSATRGDPLGLTRREREVLAEICAGQTNAAIAAKLFQNAMKPRFHGVLTPWNPGSSASGGANETTESAESL